MFKVVSKVIQRSMAATPLIEIITKATTGCKIKSFTRTGTFTTNRVKRWVTSIGTKISEGV